MPDREPTAGHSAGLLRGLIWAGVLLAPLAAAVVLIGGSAGSTRFAVLLLAVSVVLVGASVLIRNDPSLQRMDVEDRVAEEVRTLRRELRAEFGRPIKGNRPSQSPPPERSDFFRDAPMIQASGDDFAGDAGPAAGDGDFVGGPPPAGPGFAPNGGGRASVPVAAASASVRPPPPGMSTGAQRGGPGPGMPGPGMPGPGMSTGGQRGGPGPGMPGPGMSTGGQRGGPREPGAASGGRPAPGRSTGGRPAPAGPAIPHQRPGTGTVTPPPAAASATVRPGAGGTSYGRADSLDSDFGASNGYADAAPNVEGVVGPGVYGGTRGGTYGRPSGGHDSDSGGDYPSESGDYGLSGGYDSGEYPGSGYADGGYASSDGSYEGPDETTGDPDYKARRHRPSANDTNVGTLADFAAYGGYDRSGGGYDRGADERYVQGYDPNGYGRW